MTQGLMRRENFLTPNYFKIWPIDGPRDIEEIEIDEMTMATMSNQSVKFHNFLPYGC